MSGGDGVEKEVFSEKEYYRQKIIEMVEKIENMADLEMLYGMASAAYRDIQKGKAGGK